ncbi:hypothetical protein [Cryobacterium breve]|nr:hypothetical protein [Cryobacterium breve]
MDALEVEEALAPLEQAARLTTARAATEATAACRMKLFMVIS